MNRIQSLAGRMLGRQAGQQVAVMAGCYNAAGRVEHRGRQGSPQEGHWRVGPASPHYFHLLPRRLGQLPCSQNDQCFPQTVW